MELIESHNRFPIPKGQDEAETFHMSKQALVVGVKKRFAISALFPFG